jgi:uncharacterized damage-inducible protein DinB
MKFALRVVACTLAMGLGFGFTARSRVQAQSAPAAGAQASILAEIKKDWEEQKKTMSTIADAMPEDKFDFKASPAERSYGEQVLHIAQVNLFLLKVVGGKATPPAFSPKTLKSKAEIIKAMDDTYEYGSTLLGEQTDASMMQTMTAPAFLGPSSRARVFWTLMVHSEDIYGQMVVYLRLNGIVPPASRKP